jgi:hypothetical protein
MFGFALLEFKVYPYALSPLQESPLWGVWAVTTGDSSRSCGQNREADASALLAQMTVRTSKMQQDHSSLSILGYQGIAIMFDMSLDYSTGATTIVKPT